MALIAGTRMGPYEIAEPIGAGGMGEVYRARDTRLGRDVAVKILPSEFAGDPSRRQRFELEARAVAALNHPNIVAIHDVGDNYIVSELVDGESLHHAALRTLWFFRLLQHRQPLAVGRKIEVLALTMQRTFRMSDYMSDDYAYRNGNTWSIASPSDRLPRDVCLKRSDPADRVFRW